jgi:hypothetical protein
MMVTLTKGDAVKVLSPESSLIEVLKKDGWLVEGEKPENDRDALLAEAKALGIDVHHKTGADKLKLLIAAAKEVNE